MRNIKTITHEGVKTLFPAGLVPFFDETMTLRRYVLRSLTELSSPIRLEDHVPQDLASLPFSVYKILGKLGAGDFKYVMLPKDKVGSDQMEELVDLIMPVLESTMPGRYLILPRNDGSNTLDLYLHFPELEITNRMGLTHTIYDMVTRMNIGSTSISTTISGMRFSLSRSEISKGYSHSHLHTNQYGRFNAFCLGSSGLATFLTSNQSNLDANLFTMLIFQLEAYLKWESLEGTPYISFTTLGSSTPSDIVEPVMTPHREEVLTSMANDLIRELDPTMLTPASASPGTYYLDYGLHASKVYEMEKRLTARHRMAVRDITLPFDELGNTYVRTQQTLTSQGLHSDILSNTYKGIRDRFKITPRVIAGEEQVHPAVIDRLSPKFLTKLFDIVNNKLLNSSIVDETYRIEKQSESSDNASISVTSLMPA